MKTLRPRDSGTHSPGIASNRRPARRLRRAVLAASAGAALLAGGAEAGPNFLALGDLAGGGFLSSASGTSADGSVVVGFGDSASGAEAFRWTAGGGMVGLGGISSGPEAFRWTSGGGMVGLGDLGGGGFFSLARGISADGAVVVGASSSASGTEAFRWTAGGGMVGLGDLAGGSFFSDAVGTSADGTVVVGRSSSGDSAAGSATRAFVWDAAHGMQDLNTVLTDAGVDLQGFTMTMNSDEGAGAISADGVVVVGRGINSSGEIEAFRVSLASDLQKNGASVSILKTDQALTLAGGETLTGGGGAFSAITGGFAGAAGSSITATTGDMQLGDALSLTGFSTLGSIDTGANTVTLLNLAGINVNIGDTTIATGGTLSTVSGVNILGALSLASGGTLDVGSRVTIGGSLTVATGGAASIAQTSLTGGTLNSDLVVVGALPLGYRTGFVTGNGVVNAGIIGDASGVISASGGSLALGNAASAFGFAYDGTLNVNAEAVTLNAVALATLGTTTTLAGGSLSAANGMQLAGGRSLSGNGTVNDQFINQGTVDGTGGGITFTGDVSGAGDYLGTVDFAGTFRPGNSPAQVLFETLNLSGNLQIELGGLTAGTEFDQLLGQSGVFSTANLGGTLDVQLIALGGGSTFAPVLGDSFDIIIADDILGGFTLLDFPTLFGGLFFTGGIFDFGDGRDVYRLTVADANAVPEPSTLALFLTGSLLLMAAASRRRTVSA